VHTLGGGPKGEEVNQELAREDVDPERAPKVLGALPSSWI
jgi:hypothetical protein